MSKDTIYRQAAIDAIMGQPPEPHYPSWYAEQIKKLPSAQPEIIRCKDCKHRHEAECPMYYEEEIEEWDDDGYTECDMVIHDWTEDDGYCDRGERRTDDER